MSLNKPKYTLMKNTMYALEGLLDVYKNESSFKLQLLLFAVLNIVAWILPIAMHLAMILTISTFFPIMAEVINSAIERVVDLVTLEYHPLAKRAKDIGATIVFLSFVVTGMLWAFILYLGLVQ